MYDSLEGMYVTIYMDGGWEITGEIYQTKPDSFFIKSNNSIYMIFKNKISALLLTNEEKKNDLNEGSRFAGSVGVRGRKPPEDSFPMNSSSYDDSGMTLPETLLDRTTENTEDFSVFFSANSSDAVKNTGITFEVANDDSDEET